MKTSATLIIVFFMREQEFKKHKENKRANVHLLATYAMVICWRSVFYNTISAMSFATLLQHHLCNIAFCNNTPTPLL
jgi:hypothetical protein